MTMQLSMELAPNELNSYPRFEVERPNLEVTGADGVVEQNQQDASWTLPVHPIASDQSIKLRPEETERRQ